MAVPTFPTLADYPHLVAQLDRKKCGRVDPSAIRAGSQKKLWWRCPVARDHVWEARVVQRTLGNGCPFCRGFRVSVTNSLQIQAKSVAREWHPTKNGSLRPSDVVAGSTRRVFWRCRKDPSHEWEAPITARTQGHGCPFCSGLRVWWKTSLAAVAPHVAEQWHPTKNGALTPGDVTAHTNNKAWWKCPGAPDHEWHASIFGRVDRGRGCPFCAGKRPSSTSSLAALFPKLAAEWHPTKNGTLTPADVLPGADRFIFWRCRNGHEWRAILCMRVRRGSACTKCRRERHARRRSLAKLAPLVARQWHPTKNGQLTPSDVPVGSSRRVWWKCQKGSDHEWQAGIAGRARSKAPGECPFCLGKRLSKTNCFAARFPKVAKEWHPTKNGRLTPRDVFSSAHKRFWWKCQFGHEWQTSIYHRTYRGQGCPVCFLQRTRRPALTGRSRTTVHFAKYEGKRHGPVRRVKG